MQLHWKNSVFVINKTLRLFVNTLTGDEKHYLLNRDNLTQPIEMQLYQNKKLFLNIFLAFLKSIFSFKHFPKKMTLINDVFPEILAPKDMLR